MNFHGNVDHAELMIIPNAENALAQMHAQNVIKVILHQEKIVLPENGLWN